MFLYSLLSLCFGFSDFINKRNCSIWKGPLSTPCMQKIMALLLQLPKYVLFARKFSKLCVPQKVKWKFVFQVKYAPNPLDTNYLGIVNLWKQNTSILITDRYIIKEHIHCKMGGKSNILWRHWTRSHAWKPFLLGLLSWTHLNKMHYEEQVSALKHNCLTPFSMILWFYKIWT